VAEQPPPLLYCRESPAPSPGGAFAFGGEDGDFGSFCRKSSGRRNSHPLDIKTSSGSIRPHFQLVGTEMVSFFYRSLFASISFFVFDCSVANADCLPPQTVRVIRPIALDAGLGIKQIWLFHARDQNTFHDITVCAPHIKCESVGKLMQNREHYTFVPNNPILRNGSPGVVVSYQLGSSWHEQGRVLQMPRIDHVEALTGHQEYYFTSCGDPFAATELHIIFSNAP
jgi:hypothetical protein